MSGRKGYSGKMKSSSPTSSLFCEFEGDVLAVKASMTRLNLDCQIMLPTVAKVVPKVVPSISTDEAKKPFPESLEQGVAVLIVSLKDHAEFYAQTLLRGGVRSAIEPDSNMA